MNNEMIEVYGAREHNLKSIDVQIPKNKLVVITGLSGSGKSTLAFDTLYAEGQRRYIESLSSYARQFLDKIGKPDVDKINGLTPAIAIDQKSTSKNPRSTVGTITEIYDYLRLLFARVGKQHCFKCNKPISQMGVSDIIKQVQTLPNGSKAVLLAPLIKEKKGSFTDLIESLRLKGYIRAMIDGVMVRLDEDIELNKNKKHTIKVVVDRVTIKKENYQRVAEDVEKALKLSYGELEINILNSKEVGAKEDFIHYSEHFACFDCKISFDELEPLSFSFNSPKGACKSCDGLGVRYSLDMRKVIDPHLSIKQGAVKVLFGFNKSYYFKLLSAFCQQNGIDMTIPYELLKTHEQKAILNGSCEEVEFTWKRHTIKREFEGVTKIAFNLVKDDKDLNEYMSEKICEDCGGYRLNKESLSVKVAKKNIAYFLQKPIEDVYNFFSEKSNFDYFDKQQEIVSKPILKEILERVYFLYDVGLGYLSLGRDARTISGGEAQRIRIASQIGSGLTGVMYVLDEPSIGLHERDTIKLIRTLKNLKNRGNSVIVVEHDKKTILSADYIIDVGPKAGDGGGEIIFSGEQKDLKNVDTLSADYLFGKRKIDYYKQREFDKFIEIKNVNINNIKNLSVKIPLRILVAITGVSGSGKSSLILQTLLPVAREILNRAKSIKKVDGVECTGLENLDKVIYLDQSPIGRTSRSNPATYTGVMDEIRVIFSKTKEAELRGYKIGRFSFNVKGGRCEKCQGEGEIKIEMHFLPDIQVKCDACGGHRYNAQTLEIEYRGKNISQVLSMSVDEAYKFFENIPKIHQKLKTMKDVGLGYIKLGQNATTLSGGEAQRMKLSKELSRKDSGNTLYILDEPTTGLHFGDVDRLTQVLQHLVDLGNSVIVIEHNLDIVKNADYIIDMGPEGGVKGGMVVDMGRPQDIVSRCQDSGSYTGKYLKDELL
jgi:excinuclease ABC subunit A